MFLITSTQWGRTEPGVRTSKHETYQTITLMFTQIHTDAHLWGKVTLKQSHIWKVLWRVGGQPANQRGNRGRRVCNQGCDQFIVITTKHFRYKGRLLLQADMLWVVRKKLSVWKGEFCHYLRDLTHSLWINSQMSGLKQNWWQPWSYKESREAQQQHIVP